MNILILSAGTRNKIVQYFKKELQGKGKVIATDCSELAPAIYEADKYYIVPKIDNPEYIDVILDICKQENIDTLISLIDPELSLISRNIKLFNNIGVKPIISDYDKVEMCFDKYKMYEFLVKNNIKTIKTYIDIKEFYEDLENKKINLPVFVKPIRGSASLNINKINSKEELEVIWKNNQDLIIQEYMRGQEIGADVYIDIVSNEPVAIFT